MAAHRYWRISMTAGASPAFAFSEIQFRITAGVSLTFSGGTASAADTFSGAPASNATDGSISTVYSSNNKTPPQWWAYDFGATSGNWRDVAEIAITARNDSNYTQSPTNFFPEWSDDNITWTSMREVVTSWASAGQVQAFSVLAPTAYTPVLLCHFNGTNGSTTFTDTSIPPHTLTPTSATVSTAAPKFGTGNGNFTANAASRIDTGNAADFNLGAGRFTMEAWINLPGNPAGLQVILSQWGSSNRGWMFGMNGLQYSFYWSLDGTTTANISNGFFPTGGQWYHCAVDRDGANLVRLYLDGVVQASATVAGIFAATRNCLIGNDGDLNHAFLGQIDDARIIVGATVYGGAFTPPVSPFPDPSAPVVPAGGAGVRAMVLA